MKEFYYTIEVIGYIQAKSSKKAFKNIRKYRERYVLEDSNPTITIKEM